MKSILGSFKPCRFHSSDQMNTLNQPICTVAGGSYQHAIFLFILTDIPCVTSNFTTSVKEITGKHTQRARNDIIYSGKDL